MFQKVHIKLTLLCASITIAILFIFTGIYLSVFERNLLTNHNMSFQTNISSLITNLGQNSGTINSTYLKSVEQSNNYLIFLWDNNVPFIYNTLSHSSEELQLMDSCVAKYEDLFDTAFDSLPLHYSYHNEFVYEDIYGKIYDVCRASLYFFDSIDTNRNIQFLIISSHTLIDQQIHRQRFIFLGLSSLAAVLLTAFAWFFTGRLLKPIMDSQQKQIRFVASASHELRTPLSVIRASMSTKAPGYEDTVLSECVRMGMLVDDMLLLTTMENQSISLNLKPIEPDTFLLNIYEQLEPLARDKNIKFEVSLPDTVLPTILVDRERLVQVFYILVQNSLSYTPSGGKVILSVSHQHHSILFSVIDNGIGITDEDKIHIFERFYRADTARNTKDHFGLGLCIAKEIIDAHKGKILVSDTPGGGSTFIIQMFTSPL